MRTCHADLLAYTKAMCQKKSSSAINLVPSKHLFVISLWITRDLNIRTHRRRTSATQSQKWVKAMRKTKNSASLLRLLQHLSPFSSVPFLPPDTLTVLTPMVGLPHTQIQVLTNLPLLFLFCKKYMSQNHSPGIRTTNELFNTYSCKSWSLLFKFPNWQPIFLIHFYMDIDLKCWSITQRICEQSKCKIYLYFYNSE